MKKSFIKDPEAVLDFGFNWKPDNQPWLAPGEIIISSQWVVVPAGELSVQSDCFTDNTTTVWLEDGILGRKYTVVNHITTNLGREDDRSFTVSVRHK